MGALVSVIMPAYNHGAYVQQAIRSIIMQSYDEMELLVIDDGSLDDTFEKIQAMQAECEARFVRFFCTSRPNKGVTHTLNQLVGEARGDYVYIIASDDMASPVAVAKHVDFLDKNPDYALVVGDNAIVDSDGRKGYWDAGFNLVYERAQAKYTSFGHMLRAKKRGRMFGRYSELYSGNHVPNGYLIRKSVYEKTGLYIQEAPLEDWYMNLQIAKYAKMKYLDEELFFYRWHKCNTVQDKEKMQRLTNATHKHEATLIETLDLHAVSKDVQDCVLYGTHKLLWMLWEGVFEIRKIKRKNMRAYFIRLFGVDVFLFKRRVFKGE